MAVNRKERKRLVFKRALQRPASLFSGQIYEYRMSHREWARDSGTNAHFKIFEDFHEILTEVILNLHRQKKSTLWSDYNIRQALLFSKIPKTLFSAFQQLLNGDYDETNATLRISYESLLRILYIQKYPERADEVICNKKGIFVAANVLTQEYPILSEDKLYKILSYPVHALIDKMLHELIEGHKTGGIILNLGYKADKKALYRGMNLLITVLYFSLRIFTKIFQNKLIGFEAPNYKPIVEALKMLKLDIHMKSIAQILKLLGKYGT